MLRTIEATTDRGLEGMLRVITTLRRKTFEVVNVDLASEADSSQLRIVIQERPDRNCDMAVNYMKQIYEVREVNVLP